MTSPLLLIGASVRAAAQSAHRAGFEPYAIDLFGDRDLREVAHSRISINYPADIPAIAEDLPDAPFVYTGALENSPEVLTALSRTRTLWGNDAAVTHHLRDPFRLQAFLEKCSFPTIPLREPDDRPGDPAGWLVKPRRSAHGSGIRYASRRPVSHAWYFQRLLPGVPIGAAFLADGTNCRLIGTHRQLVGLPQNSTQPFRFSGAIAPAGLATETNRTIAGIGSSLVRWSGLKGLFGCDFLLNSDGPHLLEVNPRYTAAMELWESPEMRSLIGQHVAAFRDGILPETATPAPVGVTLKLILYAPDATRVPPGLKDSAEKDAGCRLADLPEADALIERDHPICTLLVSAGSPDELQVSLRGGIESVAGCCGWEGESARSLYRQTAERIRAEFS